MRLSVLKWVMVASVLWLLSGGARRLSRLTTSKSEKRLMKVDVNALCEQNMIRLHSMVMVLGV